MTLQVDGSRLELRAFQNDDSDALHDVIQSCFQHLSVWLPDLARVDTPQDAHDWISRRLTAQAAGTSEYFGIWEEERLLGSIGYHNRTPDGSTASLGCWLAEREQGRGLMLAAARTFVSFCFNDRRTNRLLWDCELSNVRSTRLAERLGFSMQEIRSVPSPWHPRRHVEQVFYALDHDRCVPE